MTAGFGYNRVMLRFLTLPPADVERLAQEVRREIGHPDVRDVRLREFIDSVGEPALDVMIIVDDEESVERVDIPIFMRYAGDLRERLAAEGDERWVYPWIGTEEDYQFVTGPYTEEDEAE